MTDEKIIDRGGVKKLWKRFVSKLKAETEGFAAEEDIINALNGYGKLLPYTDYGTISSSFGNNASFTIDGINPFEVKPLKIIARSPYMKTSIYLPSSGTYFLVSSDLGGFYSGGAKIIETTGDSDTTGIKGFVGLMIRLS